MFIDKDIVVPTRGIALVGFAVPNRARGKLPPSLPTGPVTLLIIIILMMNGGAFMEVRKKRAFFFRRRRGEVCVFHPPSHRQVRTQLGVGAR